MTTLAQRGAKRGSLSFRHVRSARPPPVPGTRGLGGGQMTAGPPKSGLTSQRRPSAACHPLLAGLGRNVGRSASSAAYGSILLRYKGYATQPRVAGRGRARPPGARGTAIRCDAGNAASCSAYHTGWLVLPARRVISASSGSRSSRMRTVGLVFVGIAHSGYGSSGFDSMVDGMDDRDDTDETPYAQVVMDGDEIATLLSTLEPAHLRVEVRGPGRRSAPGHHGREHDDLGRPAQAPRPGRGGLVRRQAAG